MRDINKLLEKRGISDYKSITEFDCFNENLTSLKGIEKLVNLEVLDCDNNQLTNIDLSKNVNLENLDCMYNKLNKQDLYHQINNITSVNYPPIAKAMGGFYDQFYKKYKISR